MPALRVAVPERVAAAGHVLQPPAGRLGHLLEPGREDERLQPHAQGVGAPAVDQVGQLAHLVGLRAPLVQLDLQRGHLAGQRVEAAGAAPGAVELGDGLVALPGRRRRTAPPAPRGRAAAARSARSGSARARLRDRERAVVLGDAPVERRQPAGVEQRAGGLQQVGEPGLGGPLLGRSAGGVGGRPRPDLVGLGGDDAPRSRSASVVSRAIRSAQPGVVAAGRRELLGSARRALPARRAPRRVRACSSSRSAASAAAAASRAARSSARARAGRRQPGRLGLGRRHHRVELAGRRLQLGDAAGRRRARAASPARVPASSTTAAAAALRPRSPSTTSRAACSSAARDHRARRARPAAGARPPRRRGSRRRRTRPAASSAAIPSSRWPRSVTHALAGVDPLLPRGGGRPAGVVELRRPAARRPARRRARRGRRPAGPARRAAARPRPGRARRAPRARRSGPASRPRRSRPSRSAR